MPWATSGTQKWKGASPSFMAMARVITMDAAGSKGFMVDHWPE